MNIFWVVWDVGLLAPLWSPEGPKMLLGSRVPWLETFPSLTILVHLLDGFRRHRRFADAMHVD